LVTIEPAGAWQELPPVLLDDLYRACCPARPLGSEGQIVLRQQSPAIATGGVVGAPSLFQDRQPEVAVLANRVARPAAGGIKSRATDQAHGAVDDDRVDFVALHHADIEEAGIFGIHGAMNKAAAAVT